MSEAWQATACILCSQNCGIDVQLEGRKLARFRGDRAHPMSQGYTCEKALRLDYYQNGKDRLTSPLRRRPDGTFEEIDWDTAIREIAARLASVRDLHGGESIFYYGGGGQGNHLGGAYARATRAALGSIYTSNALPTFGGAEIQDTQNIYSWDENNGLTYREEFVIDARDEEEAAA